MKKYWPYYVAIAGCISVVTLFQNCGGFKADRAAFDSSSTASSTTDVGTVTGPSGSTAVCSTNNLAQSSTTMTITGANNLPTLNSSYIYLDHTSGTTLTLVANSICVSRATYTTTNGLCYNLTYPNMQVLVFIECDNTNTAPTSCTNLASNLNAPIDLSSLAGAPITVSVNTFDAQYHYTQYTTNLNPTSRVGTVTFVSPANLAFGQVASAVLNGVEVIDTADATQKLTLNGTISGEIMAKTCTQGY